MKFLWPLCLVFAFTVQAKSVKNPLDQKSISLIYYKKVFTSKKVSVDLVCNEEVPTTPLKDCKEYALYLNGKKSKENPVTFLGKFPSQNFSGLTRHIAGTYNTKFNAAPLINGTVTGFLLGYFVAEEALGIPLALIGIGVDAIKAPIIAPYLVVSKIHRKVQLKKMKKRFSKLLENKKFRPTRIIGRKHFDSTINHIIEWTNFFR